MNSSSRFPTYHIPDDGTRYAPGEAVYIDHSSGRIQIVKDPAGDYEIVNCRPATEYGGDPPLLRLGLRRRVFVVAEDPAAAWPARATRATPFGRRRLG